LAVMKEWTCGAERKVSAAQQRKQWWFLRLWSLLRTHSWRNSLFFWRTGSF